jgi:hypothetical protein
MINVTSQYPTQTFLSSPQSQIISQVNGIETSAIKTKTFPKVYNRISSAGVAPDGSLAVMYQYDCLIKLPEQYSYTNTQFAQQRVLEAAAQNGNEYYIEMSPLNAGYYQILTWASNA